MSENKRSSKKASRKKTAAADGDEKQPEPVQNGSDSGENKNGEEEEKVSIQKHFGQ